MSDILDRIVIHFDELGNFTVLIEDSALVDVLVVDERVPSDRVFRMTPRHTSKSISELLRSDPIGHNADARHAAVENAIIAAVENRPKFGVVEGGKKDDE